MGTKVALVTGANSGIGKEVARALARAGHTVLVLAGSLRRAEGQQVQLEHELTGDAFGLLEVPACENFGHFEPAIHSSRRIRTDDHNLFLIRPFNPE